MNFKEIYKSTNSELKIKFLDLLIAENKKLENKFIEFWKESVAPKIEKSQLPISFTKSVEKYKNNYLADLENIDLEPNWDDCNCGSYYRDEWEIAQDEGDNQIEEIFEDVKSELLDLVLSQDIEIFIAAVFGLYEACKQAEIYDKHYAYEDINGELLNQFASLVVTFSEKIDNAAFNDNKTIEAINEFFNYLDANRTQENSFINLFEPLLLAFATTTNQAQAFLDILVNSKVHQEDIPQLTIKLMQNSFNDNRWIDVALSLYKDNDGVAINLLEYYYTNNSNKFVVLAKELLANKYHNWSKYLEDKVSIKQNKELFFIVIKNLTISESSINHYIKIRDLFDKESFKLFSQELKYKMPFLVEILTYEKDYEAIKLIAKQTKDNDVYFDKIIEPILNIYPDFCFATIKKRLNNKIEHERGRDNYIAMAKTLLLSNNIKGFQKQSHELMMQLYNNKPNLPALRDEFRRAGLM